MTARKSFIVALYTILAATLIISVGCSEGQKAKDRLQQALLKQTDMNQYRSSGHAEIHTPSSPLALDWNGVSSKNPLRVEADLKLSMSGSEKSLEMPLIVQDNRLYLQIPGINQKDEYFLLDSASTSGSTGIPLAENVKNADQLFRAAYTALIQELDSGWFHEDPKPAKLEDGTQVQTVSVTIDANNAAPVSAAWSKNMPSVFDALRQYGMISEGQANKWKADWTAKKLQLEAPGEIGFAIDSDGWIRQQNIKLQFTVAADTQQPERYQIVLSGQYDGINQSPNFQKEIPAKTKPAGDILKLLLHK